MEPIADPASTPRKRGKRTRGKGARRPGRNGHRDLVHAAKMAKRQEKVYDLLLEDQNLSQIAKQVGVSVKTVSFDVNAGIETYRELGLLSVAQWVPMELDRLSKLRRPLWRYVLGKFPPQMKSESKIKLQLESVDRWLSISKRMGQLRGERQPDAGYSYEQVAALVRALTGGLMSEFADAQGRERIVKVLERLGPDFGSVIDVPVEHPALEGAAV